MTDPNPTQPEHPDPQHPHPEQKEQPMSTPTYQPPTYQPSPAGPPRRRLVRSRDDRWLGGVCGGLAEYAGIDPTLVRVLVVLGTVLGFGSLVVAYLAAWILMPEA